MCRITRLLSSASINSNNCINKRVVTLISGDLRTSHVINCVKDFLQRIKAPLQFEAYDGIPSQTQFEQILKSIRENKLALKGSWVTDLDTSNCSLNVALRRELDLWANVVHVKSKPFICGDSAPLDFVIIRQNTEGEYSQIEHESVLGYVEMFKVITKTRSKQIAEFACEYAKRNNRKKVTCIHKANIMKMTDGLFLSTCMEVAKSHPNIEMNSMIVDNAAMQLVMRPHSFDIILLPNLYGNIMVSIASGILRNSHLLAGVNYNPDEQLAVFESATRSLEDNVSKPTHSNPISLIMAASKLLKHIGQIEMAADIERAVHASITEGSDHRYLTPDMGGSGSCSEYIKKLEETYYSNKK